MIGRDYGPLKENNFNKEVLKLPVDTRRLSTSMRRRTTSHHVVRNEESNENRSFLLKNRHKCRVLLSRKVLLNRSSF